MNRHRRKFLRAAAAGGIAYAFGRAPGTVYAQMAGTGGFPDYKALVCVFMFGGNDSWNTVIPTSTAEYDAYFRSRAGGTSSSLAIDRAAVLPLNLAVNNQNGATFGLHPAMPGMQQLFNDGRAAVVANVGPLIQPTNKAQYQSSVNLPPQLFSHNDQQDQWHSLRGRNIVKSGWAGRVADVLDAQVTGQQLSLNVSLAGQTFFHAGDRAVPYVMGATGASQFTGMAANSARRGAFQNVLNASYGTVYERAFAAVQRRALASADRVNAALAAGTARNFTSLPDSGVQLSTLSTQLRTVAKLIDQRNNPNLRLSRQIFFVSVGGFDTHDDQLDDHPVLLGNVSDSIKRFYDAMVEIGMQNNVTIFTHSDFARTLTSNGDGTDHAWGGVQFVVGGAVRGAQFYGQYPSLALNGPLDVGGGRFIPTVSADQYAATLASWFGVPDAQLAQVAPSIGNFTQRNLGFLG